MRTNSSLSTTSFLDLFLLPLGLPRLHFSDVLAAAFFASFRALLAAFSFRAAHNLCHLQWIRTLGFYIHQREGEKCQAGDHPLLDTEKEPIQPVGCFTGFAGNNFNATRKYCLACLRNFKRTNNQWKACQGNSLA